MVFTLHRYIFWELFKIFVLAVVALTVILSLGSILRPVREYGVGPRQVVALMGYFLPITLTFVLPMAALFAGALVYGRLAGDNELDACKTSGISLLTLIYPGLALAIIVAIANLVLSFYVMPIFVHQAERSLKADAKQILFRNIQRRGYYKLPPDGEYLIYADQVNSQNDTLSGVVVTQVKDHGIKKITTAERATVKFKQDERFEEIQQVQISSYNTFQFGSGDEGGVSFERGSFTAEFGSLLGDKIKFKKIDEMKSIRADLKKHDLPRFYPIEKLARETYAQFTAELLAQDIEKRLTAEDADRNTRDEDFGELSRAGRETRDEKKAIRPSSIISHPSSVAANSAAKSNFYKLHSGEKFVEFTASRCAARDEKQVELSGEVVVVEYDTSSKQHLCTLRAAKAFLGIEGDELAPTLTMDVYNAMVEETGYVRMRHIIRGLIPPKTVRDKLKTGKVLDDIDPEVVSSALEKGPSPRLIALQNKLQRKIRKTLARIEAEIHSRLVFGIGCVSMILIGIGLGIIKKGGHLLSAFGASCVPAMGLIVCIMCGKNITKNLGSQSVSGIALMWVGLVFLSILAVGIYCKLLKN